MVYLKKHFLSIIQILLCALVLYGCYHFQVFKSPESMHQILKQAGILAPLLFIFFQIIQCVFPMIPGGFGCIIGVSVFQPFWGFVYNFSGIVLGSTINFLLAKRYGKNFILKIVKQEHYDRYISWIEKGTTFDKLFTIAILSPLAPDDLLCYIAGLTPMSLHKFLLIQFFCKPWSILAYSFGMHSFLSWFFSLF